MEEYQSWVVNSLSLKLYEKLRIHDLGNGERGVYLDKNENENERIDTLSSSNVRGTQSIPTIKSILLTIPFNSLLTIHSIDEYCPPLISMKNIWKEDDLLAVFLLFEKYYQKEQSKWSYHIQYLPQEYHNIINLYSHELELIHGSNLYHLAIQWKEQIQKDYHLIYNQIQVLFSNYNSIEWFTYETYLWSLCTIWSRFVTIQRNSISYRSMVPYFDMLNHSPTSSIGHIYLSDIDSLALVTTQSLNYQQEITLNYGELSNGKLMMLYGFCLVQNPFDYVELYTTGISNEVSEYNFKKELLHLWGIDEMKPFRIGCMVPSGGIPKELVYSLRVQYGDWGYSDESDDEDEEEDEEEEKDFTSEELKLIENFLNNFEESISKRKRREKRYKLLCGVRHGPVSLGNEMIISQLLLQSLTAMIQGYPTTIEEDKEILMSWNVLKSNNCQSNPSPVVIYPSEREKNCILLRYTEKIILHNAINWINNHMTNLLLVE